MRERKGGWGRRGRHGPRILALSRQPAWRDRLVALVHVARQRGPRQSQHGHTVGPPGHLSRQWCWCDNPTLSFHCVPKPSKDCIFHLVAWQVLLVAPLPVARQISFVAPPGVARQAQNLPASYLAALPCFCCWCLLLLLSRCCLLLLLVLKLLMVQ